MGTQGYPRLCDRVSISGEDFRVYWVENGVLQDNPKLNYDSWPNPPGISF